MPYGFLNFFRQLHFSQLTSYCSNLETQKQSCLELLVFFLSADLFLNIFCITGGTAFNRYAHIAYKGSKRLIAIAAIADTMIITRSKESLLGRPFCDNVESRAAAKVDKIRLAE
jgi:hypothetical protein